MKIQLLFLLVFIGTAIKAQITPVEAGYVDAVTDYGADNTGGLYGMDMIPGSGGSIAKMNITGGKVGNF